MNKDDIMKLEGEELDRAVAELVMGWHVIFSHGSNHWEDADGRWGAGVGRYPEDDDEFLHTLDFHPSESILWAWEVVEKIPLPFCLTQSAIKDGWCAEFLPDDSNETINCIADTAPLAISRAALIAALRLK